jgi:hypothetical protein
VCPWIGVDTWGYCQIAVEDSLEMRDWLQPCMKAGKSKVALLLSRQTGKICTVKQIILEPSGMNSTRQGALEV